MRFICHIFSIACFPPLHAVTDLILSAQWRAMAEWAPLHLQSLVYIAEQLTSGLICVSVAPAPLDNTI